MNIEQRYDSPVIVIGWRGYPINGFCYDVIYKGEIKSRLNISRSDNVHCAYSLAFEDFKKAMKDENKIHSIEHYTGTLQEFANRKYFKYWIKRKMYAFYLWVGDKLFWK